MICPECGYPYDDDSSIVAVRDIICANCRWSGSSSKLLQVKGELKGGVDVLQQLYFFLGKSIAPQIGVKLVELGLLAPDKDPGNVVRIARVLSLVSRASFRSVLESLAPEESDERTIH